ncbi:hypothetical protein ACTHGU_20770 [Chitinophagaceae bacterium MMS25-I14]
MKARFKTMILSALGAMAAFSAVTYSSCSPDKCKAIVCAYGGVCNDGACVCPSGYEGPQCESVVRDKFTGVWNVLETGTISQAAQYTVSVENSTDDNKLAVVIRHFHNNLVDAVQASVLGDTLFIPQQTVNNYTLEGKGYLVPDKYYSQHAKLTLYYYITGPNGQKDDFGTQFGKPAMWNK